MSRQILPSLKQSKVVSFEMSLNKHTSHSLVNVGMVDFSHESHFGGRHGILLGEEELQLEDAAFKGRLRRGEREKVEKISKQVNKK